MKSAATVILECKSWRAKLTAAGLPHTQVDDLQSDHSFRFLKTLLIHFVNNLIYIYYIYSLSNIEAIQHGGGNGPGHGCLFGEHPEEP
jgi:hypothetical protein